MNWLFLRGEEPQDRNPKETYFDDINKCDDIYTLICYEISKRNNHVEVLYWNGERKHFFSDNLVEKRVPNLKKYEPSFKPDVIFARGGFSTYDPLVRKFPYAIKLYYGAHAKRFNPLYGTSIPDQYDGIIVDSEEQMKACKKDFPNTPSFRFIKPAPENIMNAHRNVPKQYDICFPANGRQKKFKGHEFVFSTVPKDLSLLNLGNRSGLSHPSNVTSYRVLRKDIAKEYAKCKIGIICCNKGLDSCPRVLPEMLYCNLPIVVLDTFYFWKHKYVNNMTGAIANKENFWDQVRAVLKHRDHFRPREYYKDHLSIKDSANSLEAIATKLNKERNNE